jgi:predicted metalloprotease with PDZ domain
MTMKLVYLLLASIPLAACRSTAGAPSGAGSAPGTAFLGVETDVPPEDLAREMKLELEVRQQGRLVTAVTEGSAAHQARIRNGDVLLQLDDVILYSQDDIDDFVSVHGPGDQVTATVVRRDSHEQEKLQVELGSGAARGNEGVRWQYASLTQLPTALDRARAEKRKVLVGLSGAET